MHRAPSLRRGFSCLPVVKQFDRMGESGSYFSDCDGSFNFTFWSFRKLNRSTRLSPVLLQVVRKLKIGPLKSLLSLRQFASIPAHHSLPAGEFVARTRPEGAWIEWAPQGSCPHGVLTQPGYGAADYRTPTDRDQWVDFGMLRRTTQRQLSPKLTFALTETTAGARHGLPVAGCLLISRSWPVLAAASAEANGRFGES